MMFLGFGRRAFAAFAAAGFLASGFAWTQDAPAPASTAAPPGFFERLKAGTQHVGQDFKTATQEALHPGSTLGDAYRPIDPIPGTLANIFPPEQSSDASRGNLAWPRVALTAEVYGVHQDCWHYRAKIWTSPVLSRTERFQICRSSALKTTNAVGQSTYVVPLDLVQRQATNGNGLAAERNTGVVATDGPTPPKWLFIRDIPNDLNEAQLQVLGRLIYVTGFIHGIEGGGRDYRMWFAGYEPNGNKG